MKKKLLTILQALVTIVILWMIFKDPHKRAEMAEALRQADRGWLFASFLAFGLVVACAIGRWAVLLRVQGVDLKVRTIANLFMIGLFFNFLMPGGTGGDVIKIFYLLRSTSNKAGAVLATIFDRVLGLIVLILISAILIFTQYNTLIQSISPKAQGFFYSFMVILAASIAGVLFSIVIAAFNLAHYLPAKLPGRKVLIDLVAGYRAYGKAYGATAIASLLCVVIHFASFFVFYFSARSIGFAPPLGEFMTKIPVIQTLVALPLSVGGIGLREGLFQLFFPTFSHAALIGTCGYLATLAWGLIGGLFYLAHRSDGGVSLASMQQELAKEEAIIAAEEEATEDQAREKNTAQG